MSDSERFEFGKNWQSFLDTLDQERIDQAVVSLKEMLQVESLEGKSFLDIGSGSGLFSLAAHRLGADVVSIDFDNQSVACTEHLRSTYGADLSHRRWDVGQGSVLDDTLMQSIGKFDVVYSWGVLHHTGEMDRAIRIASDCVSEKGHFFIAIYNDQGSASRRWLKIKRVYNRLPKVIRPLWVLVIAGWYEAKFALARVARLKNPLPFADWKDKKNDRGMSAWHDWVDWIGGLPFEVATPDRVIMPLRRRGFVLDRIRTVGNGWGCNEFVFRRHDELGCTND